MIVLEKDSIERLNSLLKLRTTGFEQDWEIELSDQRRIDEFVGVYLNHKEFSDSDKMALMALIMASCEDAISTGFFSSDSWNKVREILSRDRKLHSALIEYWMAERNGGDLFKISSCLRNLGKGWE